jgi:hypothetical protein
MRVTRTGRCAPVPLPFHIILFDCAHWSGPASLVWWLESVASENLHFNISFSSLPLFAPFSLCFAPSLGCWCWRAPCAPPAVHTRAGRRRLFGKRQGPGSRDVLRLNTRIVQRLGLSVAEKVECLEEVFSHLSPTRVLQTSFWSIVITQSRTFQ